MVLLGNGGIMAWYAELKRRHWYCIVDFDAIRLYKKWLWCQLPNETKEAILSKKAELAERRHAEAKQSLQRLLCLHTLLTSTCDSTYERRTL